MGTEGRGRSVHWDEEAEAFELREAGYWEDRSAVRDDPFGACSKNRGLLGVSWTTINISFCCSRINQCHTLQEEDCLLFSSHFYSLCSYWVDTVAFIYAWVSFISIFQAAKFEYPQL